MFQLKLSLHSTPPPPRHPHTHRHPLWHQDVGSVTQPYQFWQLPDVYWHLLSNCHVGHFDTPLSMDKLQTTCPLVQVHNAVEQTDNFHYFSNICRLLVTHSTKDTFRHSPHSQTHHLSVTCHQRPMWTWVQRSEPYRNKMDAIMFDTLCWLPSSDRQQYPDFSFSFCYLMCACHVWLYTFFQDLIFAA